MNGVDSFHFQSVRFGRKESADAGLVLDGTGWNHLLFDGSDYSV